MTGPLYRLQILGTFSLIRLADGKEIPLRSSSRILVALALESPGWTARSLLASSLWPDDEPRAAANRLGVALNKLKTLLHPALQAGSNGLALDSSLVSCDLHEVQEGLRNSHDQVLMGEELDELEPLLPSLSLPLALEGEEPWAKEARARWAHTAGQACLRAARLAESLQRPSLVVKAAEGGLVHDPHDSDFWRLLLTSSAALGDPSSALRRYAQASQSRTSPDEALDSLARDLRAGLGKPVKPSGFTPDQKDLASEIVEAIAGRRSTLARQVLSAPEILPLCGSRPRQMLSLLELVIHDPDQKDEAWERCLARAIGLMAWLNDTQGVQDLAPILLDHTTSPAIERAVWNSVSSVKSTLRDWPGAMTAIEHTLRLAEQMEDPIDLLTAKGNKASYLWLQADFEGSLALYREVIESLKKIDRERARYETAMALGNRAFIPVMQGDWALARVWLEESVALREDRQMDPGLLLPCLSMVRVIQKDTVGALALMRKGLAGVFASESLRFQQISLEFAAGALAASGEGSLALALLDWAQEWRITTTHPRAAAEDLLCSRLAALAGPQERKAVFPPDSEPHSLARLALRRLRRSLGED